MVWDFWKFLATSMPEVREQQGRGGGGQIWYNIWSAVFSIKKNVAIYILKSPNIFFARKLYIKIS